MVEDNDGGQVRLWHPLYGEALRAEMGTVERRQVMARLVDRAESDHDHLALAVARYFGRTTEYGFRPEFEEVLLAAEGRVDDPRLRARPGTGRCLAVRWPPGVGMRAR